MHATAKTYEQKTNKQRISKLFSRLDNNGNNHTNDDNNNDDMI